MTTGPNDDAVILPNGGLAARCTARNRRGERCKKPARGGFEVCGSHGAGYRKREEAGEKRAAGRPKSSGLYSKTPLRNLAELREEVESLALDLNNSDAEMVNLKAVTWHLLAMAERMTAKSDMLEAAVEAVEQTLEAAVVIKDGGEVGEGELTVSQARQVAAGLAAGHKLLSGIASWSDRLLDANVKVVVATKTRAETRAKLAQEEAVANFLELARKITSVIWRLAPDDEFLDLYEGTLKRELFGPMNLELPKPAND